MGNLRKCQRQQRMPDVRDGHLIRMVAKVGSLYILLSAIVVWLYKCESINHMDSLSKLRTEGIHCLVYKMNDKRIYCLVL